MVLSNYETFRVVVKEIGAWVLGDTEAIVLLACPYFPTKTG